MCVHINWSLLSQQGLNIYCKTEEINNSYSIFIMWKDNGERNEWKRTFTLLGSPLLIFSWQERRAWSSGMFGVYHLAWGTTVNKFVWLLAEYFCWVLQNDPYITIYKCILGNEDNGYKPYTGSGEEIYKIIKRYSETNNSLNNYLRNNHQ